MDIAKESTEKATSAQAIISELKLVVVVVVLETKRRLFYVTLAPGFTFQHSTLLPLLLAVRSP